MTGVQTCALPISPGIWSHNEDEPKETDNPAGNPYVGTIRAVTRALKVNHCVGDFTTSKREPYPAIGTAMGICEKFSSCPPEFPIVLCHPPHGGHTDNLGPVPARAWQYVYGRPIARDERDEVGAFLHSHGDGKPAVTELCLALFNTNEFIYLQ